MLDWIQTHNVRTDGRRDAFLTRSLPHDVAATARIVAGEWIRSYAEAGLAPGATHAEYRMAELYLDSMYEDEALDAVAAYVARHAKATPTWAYTLRTRDSYWGVESAA